MNAKKETAYMFADELIALHEVCPGADITYIANLEDRGLPKVRRDAARIQNAFREAVSLLSSSVPLTNMVRLGSSLVRD